MLANDQPDIDNALATIIAAGGQAPTVVLQMIELLAFVSAVLTARLRHKTGAESMAIVSEVLREIQAERPRPNLQIMTDEYNA